MVLIKIILPSAYTPNEKLWDSSHGGGGEAARDWHGWRAFLNGLTDCSCPAGHSKG